MYLLFFNIFFYFIPSHLYPHFKTLNAHFWGRYINIFLDNIFSINIYMQDISWADIISYFFINILSLISPFQKGLGRIYGLFFKKYFKIAKSKCQLMSVAKKFRYYTIFFIFILYFIFICLLFLWYNNGIFFLNLHFFEK